jgi:hypothetical protein
MVTIRTTLLGMGNNVGIAVPEEIVHSFGAGKRVPVRVTLKGYTYASTVAVMGGRFLIPVAKVHREAAGVAAGEELDVTLEHDAGPRTVEVPADLADSLAAVGLTEAFAALAYSHRKEHVRSVEDAKKPETRQRRIHAVITALGTAD